MDKILILGTGQAQGDIIRHCRERGMTVYACSYISGDSAQADAHFFEQINIVDADAIEQYAREKGIDCIYSAGSDIAMPTVCDVSERLGLPHFVSSGTATICNTKSLLRDTLGASFEGNLAFREITSIEDEITIPYPLMMKPVDSQGQRGVYRIDSREEFLARFEASMSHSRQKKLILEEFVDGDEISVNTFSVGGEMIFSLISDRVVWENLPGGIIHRHLIPSRYDDGGEVTQAILSLVRRVLTALSINDGPAYFQIKMKSGRIPKLLEVTPRLDGCHM
ncbi:MAG: ATP-grasp domain-containing protein, partial [Clostridia bacterium]|nr:ATP-grasp domain-containing protein [Clostridia bacterium]